MNGFAHSAHAHGYTMYGHCGQGLGSPESVCSYLDLSIYFYASYKESLWLIKENSIAAFHANFLL